MAATKRFEPISIGSQEGIPDDARNVEEPRPNTVQTVCKVSLTRTGESRRPLVFPPSKGLRFARPSARRPCVHDEEKGTREGWRKKVVALQLPRKTPPRVRPEKLLCLTNHSRLNEDTSLRSRDSSVSSSICLFPILSVNRVFLSFLF